MRIIFNSQNVRKNSMRVKFISQNENVDTKLLNFSWWPVRVKYNTQANNLVENWKKKYYHDKLFKIYY